MEKKHIKQIKKIMDEIECEKDFACYKSEFKNHPKAKNIGIQSFVECLEKNAMFCKYSLSFGDSYLCRCPLALYFVKNIKE